MSASNFANIEKIAVAFMKVFNEPKKCYRDEFNRAKSNVIISCKGDASNFHNFLISELKKRIEGLSVVRETRDITTFGFRDSEVSMNYTSIYEEGKINTDLTFTLLSYSGDMRDFD
jgi:hypothetical protein